MYPGEAKGILPFSENIPIMTFDMSHCRNEADNEVIYEVYYEAV